MRFPRLPVLEVEGNARLACGDSPEPGGVVVSNPAEMSAEASARRYRHGRLGGTLAMQGSLRTHHVNRLRSLWGAAVVALCCCSTGCQLPDYYRPGGFSSSYQRLQELPPSVVSDAESVIIAPPKM